LTKPVANIAASIRQRLLNLARERQEDFGLAANFAANEGLKRKGAIVPTLYYCLDLPTVEHILNAGEEFFRHDGPVKAAHWFIEGVRLHKPDVYFLP